MLKERLEKYIGSKIDPDKLDDAIKLHNKNRILIKDLYNIRKKNPCVLSSTAMSKILVAGVSVPADEFNSLLKQIKEEVKQNVADKEEDRNCLAKQTPATRVKQ